jgi:hypothetical protein
MKRQQYNFTKTRLDGFELFHAEGRRDGRTVMTELITAFCTFENAPKRFRVAKNKYQGMDAKFQ